MEDLLEPLAGDAAAAVSRRLIERFGSIGRAMSASPELLARALPDQPDVLRRLLAARALIETASREELASTRLTPASATFRQHLRTTLGQSGRERLHATFVAPGNTYLADELLANGEAGSIELHVRQLLERAFELEAAGIVLAHNHPSGVCEPSEADIAATRNLEGLLQQVGIRLVDHLVVTRRAVMSMRQGGYL